MSRLEKPCAKCGVIFFREGGSVSAWERRKFCSRGCFIRPLETRFWEKVIKTSECWIWTGAKVNGKYGNILGSSGKKHILASHVSWEIHNGRPVPDGMCVLHSCDNPPCVNPSHLFLGTYLDNSRDMDRKGRRKVFPGESNGRAKLTLSQVDSIRSDHRSQRIIAKDYGIVQSHVSYIKRKARWKASIHE